MEVVLSRVHNMTGFEHISYRECAIIVSLEKVKLSVSLLVFFLKFVVLMVT